MLSAIRAGHARLARTSWKTIAGKNGRRRIKVRLGRVLIPREDMVSLLETSCAVTVSSVMALTFRFIKLTITVDRDGLLSNSLRVLTLSLIARYCVEV